MNRDMFSNRHDERDFSFNSFLDGLRCLVPRNVDRRCVWFRFLLRLDTIIRALLNRDMGNSALTTRTDG